LIEELPTFPRQDKNTLVNYATEFPNLETAKIAGRALKHAGYKVRVYSIDKTETTIELSGPVQSPVK
jgi:hypothetical protein